MRIAITGGSGYLGRALLTRLTRDGADRIVTLTRDEQRRDKLARQFGWHPGFRVYAGDVRDLGRLTDIFSGCEAVIHAAARKVVTGHPDEPEEMLKTNVIGTGNVIEAARIAGCRKLVVVSSDKAVAPVNVYGVSKAMAEHLAVMANARTFGHGLRVGVVRYGNVLGSTGSVLEKWREQLAQGRPIEVSDQRMTRFWITKGQAVDLVLSVVANLRGGEIVVPVLPAAPLMRLAEALTDIDRNVVPLCDVPMERGATSTNGYTPRQGGEKLHEELLSTVELRRAVRVPGTNRIVVPPFQHDEMWDRGAWLGEPVDPDVPYSSDTWPQQLTVDGIRDLLAETDRE